MSCISQPTTFPVLRVLLPPTSGGVGVHKNIATRAMANAAIRFNRDKLKPDQHDLLSTVNSDLAPLALFAACRKLTSSECSNILRRLGIILSPYRIRRIRSVAAIHGIQRARKLPAWRVYEREFEKVRNRKYDQRKVHPLIETGIRVELDQTIDRLRRGQLVKLYEVS